MERVIDVTAARRQFGTLLDEVFHKKRRNHYFKERVSLSQK